MAVFLHPYFLLGAFGLLMLAIVAARTSYLDTPTVAPETSDLVTHLFDEVERARRLGYPLCVTRLMLRPGASARAIESATRNIDTVVVNDQVAYLLMPGCTEAGAVLERIPPDANPIAAWSAASFPADALTIGELLLKVGDTSLSRNGHSSRTTGTARPSSGRDDRASVT